MKCGISILTVTVLLILLSGISSRRLTFIVVTIGDNPLYGFYASWPHYEVAFQKAASMYPDIFRNHTVQVFHKPGLRDCLDAAAEMYATTGDIYDLLQKTDGFPILMSPGCSPEMLTLADFSREVNVPLFASTSTDGRFVNRQRYPTFLGFGSTSQGNQAPATISLLKYYKWSTVTLFCDDLILHPPASAFLGTLCRTLRPMLSGNAGYEFYLESYDSKTDPGYEARLKRAKSQSRVIIILTRADELRKIMIIAHKLNMTNSEYVYIHAVPNQGPDYIPLEVDTGSPDDQIIFNAYKQLIALTFVLPDYGRIQSYMDIVNKRARNVYNYTYDYNEKRNEITQAIPEMIFSMAKAINESATPISGMEPKGFLNLFLSKRFDIGDFRSVVFSPVGMRLCDTFYSRLNTTSRTFEIAWHYDAVTRVFTKLSHLADEWNGNYAPPLNRPACGYRNDRCTTDADIMPIIVGALCGIIAVSAILIGISIYCIKRSAYNDQSNWWLLDANLLELPSPASKCDVIEVGKYQGEPAWLRLIPDSGVREDELVSNAALRKCLAQIKALHNDCIATFYGIGFLEKTMCVVWEAGRGTLRSIFAHETIIADSAIQTYFLFNILTGLNYIHNRTPFRKHGSLSSLSVILDDRFTAKICDITAKLLRMTARREVDINGGDVVVAPEGQSGSASQEADVYSLGVIFFEILRGHAVISAKEIQLESMKVTTPLQTQARNVIGQCCAVDPIVRPTVRSIMNTLGKYQPSGTVVGSLINRLEKHAEHLEQTVAHRTEELLLERKKVDLLLAEMIPPSLVSSLRNKILVPPESYDCLTLYFSSMVGFDVFCKSRTPFEVCTFLNELYTFVDNQIVPFDVYKVETIKDGYVVASGVPIRNDNAHCNQIASLALRVLRNCTTDNLKTYLPIRIGIHSGPVAAGFVGLLMPRYCIFGDTINTASRMESHGEERKIHVSPDTKRLLETNGEFFLEPRGQINVKGKGWIDTYWLKPARSAVI
ncbi:atrial natriuretic peptide receptor 1-like isoform X2 [Paramacrobiotus metropolitanus]|uniref:atrial natriuretic peptide receptor 1-like isoform X2 n=1 Tax=Paramacrobiotus metropolitanus TaxID=2943436 RepID=UPI0024460C94|nr:atrial natriuretic peptide receptor 1-like isoform X2 [Paramacrobiotus metropolitanus]